MADYSERSNDDLDPEIWKNETLGAEGAGPFLNEIERQAAEDYNARREGREPNTVEYINRYPAMPPSGSVPSVVEEFKFITPEGEVLNEDASPVEENPVGTDLSNETTTVPVAESDLIDEEPSPVAETPSLPVYE